MCHILIIAKPNIGFASSPFERCNIYFRPQIILETGYEDLKYDHTKSTDQLMQISGREREVWGLTTLQHKSSSKISFEYIKHRNGHCLSPKKVTIYIGIADPTIYIFKDLNVGSCHYNLVRRHEEAHMQINIRIFEHFLKIVPQALRKVSQDIKPIYIKDWSSKAEVDAAASQISEEYSYILKDFLRQLKDERSIEHFKLDSEDGQHVESQICKSEGFLLYKH